MIQVGFFPVLFAGIVSVVIGFAWYHPRVFGSMWMRLSNLSPESVEKGKRRMPMMVFFGLLASMFTAYVMNHLGIRLEVYSIIGAIGLGLWCWIGFVATTMLGSVLWEQKSFKLYLINAGYWLVSFIAMAVVILLTSA